MTTAERFWTKVHLAANTDCWPWMASKRENGYGQFQLDGKMPKAHRVAWMLWNGPIPDRMVVMHSCDNRACCNPHHLAVSTQRENLLDMGRKGRRRDARGERASGAKLTEVQVEEIRKRYAAGDGSHRSLAAEYGVSRGPIGMILRGQIWKHVAA